MVQIEYDDFVLVIVGPTPQASQVNLIAAFPTRTHVAPHLALPHFSFVCEHVRHV